MWRFALLEVYNLYSDDWPEGTPADWVEKRQVAWCEGYAPDYIVRFPIRQIIWWKIRHWLGLDNLNTF